jgi:hypothetical protein
VQGDLVLANSLRDVRGVLELRRHSTGLLVNRLPPPYEDYMGSLADVMVVPNQTVVYLRFEAPTDPGTIVRCVLPLCSRSAVAR